MASILSGGSVSPCQSIVPEVYSESGAGDEAEDFGMYDFDEALRRLAAANEQLLSEIADEQSAKNHEASADDAVEGTENAEQSPLDEAEELAMLRVENVELKLRIQELELAAQASQTEDVWLERQREYEFLLEEKSEVIRGLHQRMQEMQEAPAASAGTPSGHGTGQAEEILRLKQEIEEQRRQLAQDEDDMMAQLRQSELTMARERAEMARQRQELNRVQSDLTREIEMASRDPSLRDRLQYLRRPEGGKSGTTPVTIPMPGVAAESMGTSPNPEDQKNSSIFRRIFG